jgi:type II secretory pathway component PulL
VTLGDVVPVAERSWRVIAIAAGLWLVAFVAIASAFRHAAQKDREAMEERQD